MRKLNVDENLLIQRKKIKAKELLRLPLGET